MHGDASFWATPLDAPAKNVVYVMVKGEGPKEARVQRAAASRTGLDGRVPVVGEVCIWTSVRSSVFTVFTAARAGTQRDCSC